MILADWIHVRRCECWMASGSLRHLALCVVVRGTHWDALKAGGWVQHLEEPLSMCELDQFSPSLVRYAFVELRGER